MKKIVVFVVLFLSACGFSQKEIAMHDADFKGCERITTSTKHLIYRCPANMEWVWETKRQNIKDMLKTIDDIIWVNANADTEYSWIEVVSGKSEICSEDFYYRTISKPNNDGKRYGIIGCK